MDAKPKIKKADFMTNKAISKNLPLATKAPDQTLAKLEVLSCLHAGVLSMSQLSKLLNNRYHYSVSH